ncbi:hypothetical protein ACA910_007871 [Epithemia clementina (nom. ined.)]
MFGKKRNGVRHGTSSVGSDSGGPQTGAPGVARTTTTTTSSSAAGAATTSAATTTATATAARCPPKKPKASTLKNSHHSSGNDHSLGSQTVSTRSSTATKHVRFLNVEIREFERVLTKNPSCSSGAPIGLGWRFAKEKTYRVDDFESKRSSRRSQAELVLSRQQREAIMMEWGASVHEIVEAIRSNVRAKNQRRHSVYSLGRYDRWEELMQNAGRRLKRTILLQKPSGIKAKELSAQVQPCLTAKEPIRTEEGDEPDVSLQLAQTENAHDVDLPPNHATPPEQHPKSAALLAHNLYSAEDYLGMSDPGLHEISPAQYTMNREERKSWNGTMFRVSVPLFEVDVYGDTAEVSSYLSYDDDAVTMESSEDFDDDGFGELVRDTRHWYVDGFDAPHPHRRVIPVVISEDWNSYIQQQHPAIMIQQQQQTQPWRHQGYEMEPLQYWEYRRTGVY